VCVGGYLTAGNPLWLNKFKRRLMRICMVSEDKITFYGFA